MKRSSIRNHLKPYSIFNRRKTTVNHAFASAIAPYDDFDDELVSKALASLGQDPDVDLYCAYCDERLAQTWDHVTGLVKDGRYAGFGHTLGNLLPCCQQCNSRKGGRSWREFLTDLLVDKDRLAAKVQQLEAYLARYGHEGFGYEAIQELLPQEMKKLQEVQDRILALMLEADVIAGDIRLKVGAHMHDRLRDRLTHPVSLA